MKKLLEKTLKFREFKSEVLKIVRKENYFDLVKGWESNIIYSDYNNDNGCYKSKIIVIGSVNDKKSYLINIHEFIYMDGSLFGGKNQYSKKEINQLRKFDELFEEKGSIPEALAVLNKDKPTTDNLIHLGRELNAKTCNED